MKTFQPYQLKGLHIKNRIVMPPMCMYSADGSGKANEFHQTHYETRAVGGVGLIIVEATGIVPNGRISENDLGLWNEEQMISLQSVVKKVHEQDCKIGIQLAHAGRKYIGPSYEPVGPSAIAFDEKSRVPKILSIEDIKSLVESFKQAAILANQAGFDTVEIHSAHGYLIHEFLSPISNKRTDEYGGSLENRARFLKEVLAAVREVLPPEKPLLIRVSATDYLPEGLACDDMINIINEIKSYIDIVHVSSGGLINVPMTVYPGYQLELSARIKAACKIDTIAVGMITEIKMIEEILNNERADLVALGRELLRNPYFTLKQGRENGVEIDYPHPYKRAFM